MKKNLFAFVRTPDDKRGSSRFGMLASFRLSVLIYENTHRLLQSTTSRSRSRIQQLKPHAVGTETHAKPMSIGAARAIVEHDWPCDDTQIYEKRNAASTFRPAMQLQNAVQERGERAVLQGESILHICEADRHTAK